MSWRISGALSSRPTSLWRPPPLSATRERLPAHELKGAAAAETTQDRARTSSEDEASAERELSMLQGDHERDISDQIRSGHAFPPNYVVFWGGQLIMLDESFCVIC